MGRAARRGSMRGLPRTGKRSGLPPSGRHARLLAVSAQEETPMNLAAQTEPRIDTGAPPAAPAARTSAGSWWAPVERALGERLLAWAGPPPLLRVLARR